MSKTHTTLKLSGGLNPELVQGDSKTPFEIMDAIEHALEMELDELEPLGLEESMEDRLVRRATHVIMQRTFGKWLPKGADKVVAEAQKGLSSIEDKLASIVWAGERLRSQEQWKAEQALIRRAQRHYLKTETNKVIINGKKQWDNAQVYELPPLTKSVGNSLQHEPARYATRLPSGEYVDLGCRQGKWGPVDRTGPDAAMQSIAIRLGKNIKGGAHTILQELTGLKDIVPAYTTIWFHGKWFVFVGWQKDPKLTKSRYWVDSEGKLTDERQGDEEPLSMSELDYHLLREPSELEMQKEEGDSVEAMNDDEEMVMQGFLRDDEDEEEEVDSYLLFQIAMQNNRVVELRNKSAIWLDPDHDEAITFLRKELTKECYAIQKRVKWLRAKRKKLRSKLFGNLDGPQKDAIYARIKAMDKTAKGLEQLRRKLYFQFDESVLDLEAKITKPTLKRDYSGRKSHRPVAKGDPEVIKGASQMPLNEVPEVKVKKARSKPSCGVLLLGKAPGRVHTVDERMNVRTMTLGTTYKASSLLRGNPALKDALKRLTTPVLEATPMASMSHAFKELRFTFKPTRHFAVMDTFLIVMDELEAGELELEHEGMSLDAQGRRVWKRVGGALRA